MKKPKSTAAGAAVVPADKEGALYSAFGEDGVPTHGADGEPLSKAKIKKWTKKRDRKARRDAESKLPK